MLYLYSVFIATHTDEESSQVIHELQPDHEICCEQQDGFRPDDLLSQCLQLAESDTTLAAAVTEEVQIITDNELSSELY